MIQKETNLVVADNSGARSVRAFTLYGGSFRKSASIGDIITRHGDTFSDGQSGNSNQNIVFVFLCSFVGDFYRNAANGIVMGLSIDDGWLVLRHHAITKANKEARHDETSYVYQ